MKAYHKFYREATAKEAIPHLSSNQTLHLKARCTRSVSGAGRKKPCKKKQYPVLDLFRKWGKWASALLGHRPRKARPTGRPLTYRPYLTGTGKPL